MDQWMRTVERFSCTYVLHIYVTVYNKNGKICQKLFLAVSYDVSPIQLHLRLRKRFSVGSQVCRKNDLALQDCIIVAGIIRQYSITDAILYDLYHDIGRCCNTGYKRDKSPCRLLLKRYTHTFNL